MQRIGFTTNFKKGHLEKRSITNKG